MKTKIRRIIFILTLITLTAFSQGAIGAESKEKKNLLVDAKMRQVALAWQKPMLLETEGLVLVRKENSCPVHTEDGQELYRGSGKEYIDKDLANDKVYCYGLFIQDLSGQVYPVAFSGPVKRKAITQYIGQLLEENYMILIGLAIIGILLYIHKRTVEEKNQLMLNNGRVVRKI